VVAWLSTRSGFIRRAVTSQPVLLVSDGQTITAAVQASRLTESQVMQATRSSGFGDISLVAALVLEPNGTLSVIGYDKRGSGSAIPAPNSAAPLQ
jgi:uncharacterized membrane protein YcaP (DUF421 family)